MRLARSFGRSLGYAVIMALSFFVALQISYSAFH